ncbi:MAG: hypothetical protein ABJA76_04240 [Mucilaginibacter sp.]
MKILKNLFVYYTIISLFFQAPLRFLYSFILSADFLVYAINFIFISLVLLYKSKSIVTLINNNIWVFSYLVVILLYSLSLADYKEVFYVFYVITPLLFFCVFSDELIGFLDTHKSLFIVIFLLCAAGIIYDYYYDFPWKGLSFTNLSGNSVDVSRDWTASGVERIAGFSRTSFDAAMAMLFLLILILYKYKNFIIIHITFIIAFISIYLTTTKGCLISLLLVYFVYIINGFKSAFKKVSLQITIISLSILMVSLPLGILQGFEIPILSNESFKDRINNEWPFIMRQFTEFISYVFGLGIGDVGLGKQVYGNANMGSPGDNLFIYLYANIGLLAFGLFLVVLKRLKTVNSDLFKYMAVFLFSYGITTNIVESPIGQLVIAFSLFIVYKNNDIDDEALTAAIAPVDIVA